MLMLFNHHFQAENLTYVNFLSFLMILPLLIGWAILPNDGIAIVADWFFNKVSTLLLELPFSREMETEADIVGLEIASKACFDVREAPAFWGKMALIVENQIGEVEIPEFLSTHPSHSSREKHLLDLLPKALDKRSICGCSKLEGPDPMVEFLKFKVSRFLINIKLNINTFSSDLH